MYYDNIYIAKRSNIGTTNTISDKENIWQNNIDMARAVDKRKSGCDGCELLKRFRSINPLLLAMAISILGATELAVKTLRLGKRTPSKLDYT
jgi:hypothetical protein